MSDITHNAAGVGDSPPEPLLPTIQDYLDASTMGRIEIVNGEILVMHPPNREHGLIAFILAYSLHSFASPKRLGVVIKEDAFVLDGDERSDWVRNSRIPDVAFITQERAVTHEKEHPKVQNPWWLAPDIVAEVVSPTDSYLEIDGKVAEYLRYGVRLIWVINPKLRSVRVVTPENPAGHILTDQDTLTGSPVLEGWSMPVAHIFDVMPAE
jgi:Uma2 family endonuclease